MTAQINDIFLFGKQEYSVAGISKGELFDIAVLDLKPSMCSTACYRGYQAVFAIAQSRLVLDTLHVHLLRPGEAKDRYESDIGPVINGVAPSLPRKGIDFFNNHYDNLNYHLEYSGGVLLADGFIRSLYVHMGFHPAWKYETVIELVFDAGILKETFDRSERMAEIREIAGRSRGNETSNEMPSEDEIRQFVERAFDRRYRK